MSCEKKHLTLFFISVFLHFVFFINSMKVFYFMFHVNTWTASICILTVVHTPTWLPFTAVSMFIAHATLVHRSTSMYQWPCRFRISYFRFPCCIVLIMISARVIGLRSLESVVFYNSWPAEKCKNFLHQQHLDTEEHRLIMATRCKLSRLFLRLTRDLFFYEHILGPVM